MVPVTPTLITEPQSTAPKEQTLGKPSTSIENNLITLQIWTLAFEEDFLCPNIHSN